MAIFRTYFKRRALRKMIVKMTPALIKGYGSREYYSAGQVYQAAKETGASKRYFHYNLALFCCELDAEQSDRFKLSQSELERLRSELKRKIFSGCDYNAYDIIELAKPSSWKGGRMDDYMSHRQGMGSRF